MTTQLCYTRLPLENAYNVRELGGIPCPDGGVTAWRAFLRGDDLNALSQNDIEFLLAYGVNTVIDLRSAYERAEKPDLLGRQESVAYHELPFMEQNLSPEEMLKMTEDIRSMGETYCELLDRRQAVREMFKVIAEAPPGCVLFHCAGGKDRTGVLAMLLLMLAGVDEQDIKANYMQTAVHLSRGNLQAGYPKELLARLAHVMGSSPEDIGMAYDRVQNELGGIHAYLKGCGVEEAVLDAVLDRLLAA